MFSFYRRYFPKSMAGEVESVVPPPNPTAKKATTICVL